MHITSKNIQHYLDTGSAKYIDECKMYIATMDGDVYSLYNRNKGEPRKLKPTISAGGYCRVRIYVNKKVRRLLIHRVIAKAFIPNPKRHPTVNHKDENSKNNRVDNLEWCTQKYNNNYGTRNERMAQTIRMRFAKRRIEHKHIQTRKMNGEYKQLTLEL